MPDSHTNLYRLAFRRAANPAVITDEALRIVDANDAAVRTGGWDHEELLGTTPRRFFDDSATFETAADQVEAGETWTGDFEMRSRTGQRWHARGSAVPLVESGEVVGALFHFLDLTRRRQQEESLTVLNRVLRHNLRNDANVVLGHLQDVADEVTAESQREAITTAASRVESMLDRAETTRRFGRLLAEGDDAALYPVNVARAIEQALNTLDTGDATVTVHQESEAFVLADETITAAIQSLLDNAVQYAGESPQIDVDVVPAEETVTVAVDDDGPGIDPGDEDQVFSRNETDVHHGQGLSLFFVDRLMAIYGGRVELGESDRGGARFELVFRRERPV